MLRALRTDCVPTSCKVGFETHPLYANGIMMAVSNVRPTLPRKLKVNVVLFTYNVRVYLPMLGLPVSCT